MRAFNVEMSRRGFASALAAGALSLALAGCGGGAAGAGSAAGSAATDGAGAAAEPVEVHVASLKGPTSIGLVQFMDQAADGESDKGDNERASIHARNIGRTPPVWLVANCGYYSGPNGRIARYASAPGAPPTTMPWVSSQ